MRIAYLQSRTHRFAWRRSARCVPRSARSCSGVSGEAESVEKIKPETGRDGQHDSLKANANVYDVAIIGGGMVGLALGCALSSMTLTKHLKLAIVDSNPTLGATYSFKRNEIPDSRVRTITPATISFFKELGAWKYVEEQRHALFSKMQVWDYTGFGYTRYNAEDIGRENLGYSQ